MFGFDNDSNDEYFPNTAAPLNSAQMRVRNVMSSEISSVKSEGSSPFLPIGLQRSSDLAFSFQPSSVGVRSSLPLNQDSPKA